VAALSEQEFRLKSDAALQGARRALMPLADEHDFEVELQNGVLNIVFEEPHETKFVVSPNAPMAQIWVSAMAKGYRLPWDPARDAFALDGETLAQMLQRLIKSFLGYR
jgi:CyaY protein